MKLAMKNYNSILSEKQQNISVIVSKNGKIWFLIGEETLPSDQSRIIEEAKFTYSPLGKGFEKQTKAIKGKRKKNK